ncbi:hypothetical protein [Candidatus Nitrotoga sp. 1052]|nr:hypothetical protein [Candidatus Nitrotoga sp. 1052]
MRLADLAQFSCLRHSLYTQFVKVEGGNDNRCADAFVLNPFPLLA